MHKYQTEFLVLLTLLQLFLRVINNSIIEQ